MLSALRRLFASLYYFVVNMGVLKSTLLVIALCQFVVCHAAAIESFDQVSFAAMALSATGNKSLEMARDVLHNVNQTGKSAPFDGAEPALALDLNAATAAMEGTKLDLSINQNLLFASGSVAAIAAMTIIVGSAVSAPCEPQEVKDEEEEEEDGSPMSFNGLHSLHQALDTMEKKEVSQASWPRLPSSSSGPRTWGNALDSDSDEDGNESDESDIDMYELNQILELRAQQERNAPLLPASSLPLKKCSHSRRVSFGQVSVREMLRQPGGGGSVATHGAPLGIGWTVLDEHSVTVDEAQEERTRLGKKHKDLYVIFGRVAAQAREKWMLEAGATKQALRKSAQVSAKVLRGREESNANLFFQ